MWTKLPASSLRITGPDRLDFIQGQMSHDLRGQAIPGMVPCAFLNVRGQLEQFAYAYKRQDDIYLHLDPEQAGPLAQRLKRYIIFDQVEVQDTSELLRTVHVWDATLMPWLGWASGQTAQQITLGGAAVLIGRVRRTGTPGLDLHYLAGQEDAVLSELLGSEQAWEALHSARIQAGIPDPVQDRFLGGLIQEVGLDQGGPLPAISYRKGCYVGQEIMARLEARGQTRSHLVRLQGGGLPSFGEVQYGGKVVGHSGLALDGRALARIRKEVPAEAEVLVGGQVARLEAINV